MVPIIEIINEKPCILQSDNTLQDLLELWQKSSASLVGVMEDEKLAGFVGKGLSFPSDVKLSPSTPLGLLACTDFSRVSPDTRLEVAFTLPGEVLAVIGPDERLLGLISKADLSVLLYQYTKTRSQELEATLNAAISGIIAINREGIVTTLNPAGEKIIRRRREEAIGKHLSDVIIPKGLLKVLKTGEPQFNKRLNVAFSKGTRFYVTNRSPIIEDGKVVGAVEVFQDVTDSESTSQELSLVKEMNKELQALIDSSYDAILITNPTGIIRRINQAYTRMTGLKEEEIIGRPFQQLESRVHYASSILNDVLEKEKPVTQIQVSPLGNRLLITASPVKSKDGDLRGVVINVRDLTELEILRQDLEDSISLNKRYQEELSALKVTQELNIVSHSPEMQQTIDMCTRVAKVDSTVLLLGESGVGKEVLAKLIHNCSGQASGPYVKINCGAIPEQLLESELFGYERGAFSGASKEGKAGLFEMANNGTILLDEIGELPLSLQVKLLRVLQEKEFTRVGGTVPKQVNVRVLAASNRNLEQMVQEGKFREDLYFRLNVVTVTIPPLRKRKPDLIHLLSHFKDTFCKKYGIEKTFDPEVIKIFMDYDWPGNVRELENMVEGLIVTTIDPVITRSSLPPSFLKKVGGMENEAFEQEVIPLKEAVQLVEQRIISRAIEKYGSVNQAAAMLGIDRSTLFRKMSRSIKQNNYQ